MDKIVNIKYDYLIIGAGLFGSVCARELTDMGNICLVIDKKTHIGGNCYTENTDGINVHKYGPHTFHTSNTKVWGYINKFTTFNNFVNRPKVNYKNSIYSFPINLLTLNQVYGVNTPIEALNKLNDVKLNIPNPKNFEEYILSIIGKDLYEIFIKEYTIKQWHKDPKNLPMDIVKRLPFRLDFNDNYYNDVYQGIPIGGYTQIFSKLLDGIEVKLDVDFFGDRQYWESVSQNIIYTGPIDRFYNYVCGELEYVNLRFESERLEIRDFQGNAIINYTDGSVPFTRIVEHKHFESVKCDHTIVTREYSQGIQRRQSSEQYYPICDENNMKIYGGYKEMSNLHPNIVFGGRLAEYKYYDMDDTIESALKLIDNIRMS